MITDDSAAFDASVRKVFAWDFDKLVMAHGDFVEKDAREKARLVMGM
jgi:hypothetical protein